ncbi:dihydroxyacetone kinase subunit DhaL [Thermoactinomyces mirandus]|uniref:phosphoenolpyruvate--glycerone phosphotransferase n=1 Tax=Thermoactinomyces mirandus TaxID=2756294 RepID=A0A7W1XV36_9BACL|nr:dihydroxyacetone kinase subunit DhaL [Thermoactinomyces mirandus]MBA4603748.1 dihydroxyacetone kinase subunit L [Thermoactinomyces mirandus]
MDFTCGQIKSWLLNLSKLIQEKKEELSLYDQAIGDGDHGINLARGFKEVEQLLKETEDGDIGALFQRVSLALLSKVGGASGPLYGTAFLKMAAVCKGKKALSLQEWGLALTEALNGLKMRGKAEPGDKTMIDVWEPVVDYMVRAGQDLSWQKVKDIAVQSMEKTKELQARKGRASFLGERSIGHVDPGAVSSCYLFQTLADQLQKGE